MNPFTENQKSHIKEYFHNFLSALTVYLRPYKGQLTENWLGVDKKDLSMILYFCDKGLVARLIGKQLESPIIERSGVNFVDCLESHYSGSSRGKGDIITFSAAAKLLAGDSIINYPILKEKPPTFSIHPTKTGTSFIVLAPCLYNCITQEQFEKLKNLKSDKEKLNAGLLPEIPPWIFSLISTRSGADCLDGLDKDPIIEAKALSDKILNLVGILNETPTELYQSARKALEQAVATVSSSNESSIHSVIEERPWILCDEVDFKSFSSKPRLRYIEKVKKGNKILDIEKEIIPDFLYDLHDNYSLVVEIESASKRLLIKTEETGYQLPSAKTTAAGFQIDHYKTIINGPTGAVIREQLQKPDAWTFDYLLIVGSKSQVDFNERSWTILRNSFKELQIKVRTWCYYLDRLSRLEKASHFNAPS